MEEGKYMSRDIMNELTSLMGQTVLKEVLQKIKNCDPSWYANIGDGTFTGQLVVSIRSVDDDFDISEDSIGLFALSDTLLTPLILL